MEKFTAIRDYVILRIRIAKGQRAGALLSITHETLKKKQNSENEYVTLSVSHTHTDTHARVTKIENK